MITLSVITLSVITLSGFHCINILNSVQDCSRSVFVKRTSSGWPSWPCKPSGPTWCRSSTQSYTRTNRLIPNTVLLIWITKKIRLLNILVINGNLKSLRVSTVFSRLSNSVWTLGAKLGKWSRVRSTCWKTPWRYSTSAWRHWLP
jgi:hypothetical protein